MIETENTDGVRVLRLVHKKASALDIELVQALTREIEDAAAARGVDAVVLTGTGSIFCAGVDLFRVAAGGADYVRRFLPAFKEMTFSLFGFEKPLVVAANGHAIAGGAVLVAVGDYRLMGAGSGRVGFTELQVGVPYPPAAFEVIRFGVSPREIEDVLYGAATYPQHEALALGLIDGIIETERLLPRAIEIARRYAKAGAAFALTKRQLRAATSARMHEVERAFADEVSELWCADATHASIRDYLDRTVGKRGA